MGYGCVLRDVLFKKANREGSERGKCDVKAGHGEALVKILRGAEGVEREVCTRKNERNILIEAHDYSL